MDELQKHRDKTREKRHAQQAQCTAPTLQFSLWFHGEDWTTRKIEGNGDLEMNTTDECEKVFDSLMSSVFDVMQDEANEERFEDSWELEPVFMVYCTRRGMRYMCQHQFFNTECVSWKGRIVAAGYMFRRMFKLMEWGLRLTWLCFTFKPKTKTTPTA